ncbi:Protein HIRA [Taenia crassiceps]|uniref:Protein HIRA n=1 Tax=Taenia crassiceps TaxID=6207 RepID=A0ABR4QSJ2_9CEST
MKRFADQRFDDSITPTIGVDFTPSRIEVDGRVYTLSFWDTAGAEANGMTALQPLFYRNAEGVLLGASPLTTLKVDRAVQKDEARDFALRSSMLFVETSALTSENINNCFYQLVSSIVRSPYFESNRKVNTTDGGFSLDNVERETSSARGVKMPQGRRDSNSSVGGFLSSELNVGNQAGFSKLHLGQSAWAGTLAAVAFVSCGWEMRLLKPHWVTHGSISKKDVLLRPIYTLDIHPDGKRLATGGLTDGGGLIILWDMSIIRDPEKQSQTVSKMLYQMNNHQACVNCVRWSPTGRWLASGGMDRVIMLWVKTIAGVRSSAMFGASEKMKFSEHWRCAAVLRHHTGDIIDIAWAQDGTRLASASVDNTVVIWGNSLTNEKNQPFQFVAVLRGHRGPVKGVAWDPVGRYLATQADDIGVRVWRTADWQPENKVSTPFTNAADQAEVTRLSWSPDGSVIAAPHAVNNNFPTAQLITRNRWQTGLDLVGHEKHVTCARYNPNLLKKSGGTDSPGMVCLALGGKDRCISVWTTLTNRALVVIRDLFTSSITDLTWSSSGCELLASSLDGSISYMAFTKEELGEPVKLEEVAQLHRKVFGQSLIDGLLSALKPSFAPSCNGVHSNAGQKTGGDVVLETPDALMLQRSQTDLRQKLVPSGACSSSSPSSTPNSRAAAKPPKISAQTEVRTKDGRRRITPSFLGSLDCLDEEPSTAFPVIVEEPGKLAESPPTLKSTLVSISQPKVQLINTAHHSSADGGTPPAKSVEDVAILSSDPSDSPPLLSKASEESTTTTKRRKRVEMTTISHDTKVIEKKEKSCKKRKRSSIFFEEDEEEINCNVAGSSSVRPSPVKSTEKSTDKQGRGTALLGASKATALMAVCAVDQLELSGDRAQFVCCHPVEGPIIVNIVNSEKAKGAVHRASATCSSDGNSRNLWNLSSSHRFTSHAHADNWLAIGDANCRLRLLWSVGSSICPPILLDSVPQLLATTVVNDSTVRLAVLTASGDLVAWTLTPKIQSTTQHHFGCSIDQNLPEIFVKTHLDTSRCPAISLDFSPDGAGHLVVRLKSGSCFLFHVGRLLWIELFDAGEGEDSFKRRVAATIHRTCPSGPLAAMQQFGRLEVPATGELMVATTAQRRELRDFHDAQVQIAELFGSAAEFKFWLLRWFQYLIEEGDHVRVRQVCLDFIGPFSPAGQTSWEPSIKGLSKRALVRELLSLFALNLRLQRLYVEMKELLEQTQETA